MPDFPSAPPLPLFVSTWSRWSIGTDIQRISASLTVATITWPVASTAFYIPVWLPWPYPVRRVFWVNGSSTTTTNMDFGIYTADGTRIYSTGATAAGTVSVVQYVTPTEFLLSPGRYYFALSDNSSTVNRGGQGSTSGTVTRMRLMGILQEASASPLPATMTGIAVANACYPICGITRTASGF
jgi:hypothetical protein